MDKQRVPRSAEESFVIRISSDDASASPEIWRATIVHVGSGERRYVTSYGDLCGFIDARRRRPPTAPG